MYERSMAMFWFLLCEEQEAKHCYPKETPYHRPSLRNQMSWFILNNFKLFFSRPNKTHCETSTLLYLQVNVSVSKYNIIPLFFKFDCSKDIEFKKLNSPPSKRCNSYNL